MTALAVALPVLVVLAAAAQCPTYADGTPVNRMRRSFLKDLHCLVGGTY